MIHCRKCSQDKPQADFYSSSLSRRDYCCIACTKAATKAYASANKPKVAEGRSAYRAANKDKINAQKRASRAKKPDLYNALAASYVERNRGSALESKRKWNNSPNGKSAQSAWRVRNAEQAKAIKSRYAKAHLPEGRARRAAYESDKNDRTVGWDQELTALVCVEAAEMCALRESHTGCKWEIDHVVPLRGKLVSGLHVWNNLQVITRAENRRKRNSFDTINQG